MVPCRGLRVKCMEGLMADGKLRFLGWGKWTDWGSARRGWKFVNDVPELEASEGDELYDRGPRYGEDRISLRKEDGTVQPTLIRYTMAYTDG